MKNLAVIPARAGSKRLPGKNKKPFLGKPLIQWTIDAALSVPEISLVVVTTDDPDILSMESIYPKVMFIHRKDHLATDMATSVDVVLDVVSQMDEEFDNVILLQPTSPLRKSKNIIEALKFFYESKFKQIVSVRSCPENIFHLAVDLEGALTRLVNFLPNVGADAKLVALNGAIYISNVSYFKLKKSFFTEDTGTFFMESEISIDIDHEEDWVNAEKIGARFLKGERS